MACFLKCRNRYVMYMAQDDHWFWNVLASISHQVSRQLESLASALAADSPRFMLISEISGSSEMCVSAVGGSLLARWACQFPPCCYEEGAAALEPCAAAVASGEGREFWFV